MSAFEFARAFLFPSIPSWASHLVTVIAATTIAAAAAFVILERRRQSEHWLRQLVDLSPDAMWVHRQGRIMFANDACAALFGASSAEEFLGKQVLDFAHPEDRELLKHRIRDQSYDVNPVRQNETKYLRSDGSEMCVEVVACSVIYRGAPAALVMFRDISGRKQTEEKLRQSEATLAAAQRLAHVGSWEQIVTDLADLDAHPARWSDEVFRILGFEPGDTEASMSHFFDLVHPDDRDRLRQALGKAVRDAAKSYNIEYRIVRPDGEQRTIQERADIVLDPHTRKPAKLVGIMQDITDRKRAEAQLQGANQQLAEQVQALQQRSKEITLLSEMGGWLQSCQTAEEAYAMIGKSSERLFPGWSGGFYMISPSRTVVEAVVEWGALAGIERVFAPEDCWALRRGRPNWFDADRNPTNCHHTRTTQVTESLCVPLMAQGEALGVLSLQLVRAAAQQGSASLSEQADQRLALVLAEQVSLALGNLKLRETLRNQSIRDPLTGLFNRRYMEESLERELSRASRKKTSLAILMMDLDHFKKFNDTFGHQAGDAALRALGDYLQKSTRGHDIACRYGGEEFALVLCDSSLQGALQRAETLHDQIKQLHAEYRGELLGTLSVSTGLALFPDHGSTINDVLRAADQALYCAKREGRDRVCVWTTQSVA